MSYGASQRDTHMRLATYVDKILKGARPAELPIEQPTRFELVVNAGTARTLGLTIPESLRLRADRILEAALPPERRRRVPVVAYSSGP